MKRILIRSTGSLIWLVLFFSLVSCSSAGESPPVVAPPAPVEEEAPVRKEPGGGPPTPPPAQRAGGFTEIAPASDTALRAFEFLLEEVDRAELDMVVGTPQKAYTQVVAGYNVKLFCTCTWDEASQSGLMEAKVYTDLKGTRKLLELTLDGEDILEKVVGSAE